MKTCSSSILKSRPWILLMMTGSTATPNDVCIIWMVSWMHEWTMMFLSKREKSEVFFIEILRNSLIAWHTCKYKATLVVVVSERKEKPLRLRVTFLSLSTSAVHVLPFKRIRCSCSLYHSHNHKLSLCLSETAASFWIFGFILLQHSFWHCTTLAFLL